MLRKTIAGIWFLTIIPIAWGQNSAEYFAQRINMLTYAVPFLAIPVSPAINGVITTVPDGTSGPGFYGNLGLIALDSCRFQATADFVPWIRARYPDLNLFGFGASYRIDSKHTFGLNLRYFLPHKGINIGGAASPFRPKEIAGTVFYTYNIDKLTGIGVGVKYIYSDLTGGYYVGGIKSHPGLTIAADIGFAKQLPGRNGRFDHFIGIALNNFGSKISYTQNSDKDFIPITLAAGYGLRLNLPGKQSLALSYECSKLLIPTPPVYYPDSLGASHDPVIQAGYDPNVGVFRGMMQSFYDAPGGFQEELHEIVHSFGMVYKTRFLSAGAGYHAESAYKSNNKFFSLGLSGILNFSKTLPSCCRLNVSYLIPVNKHSALRNTVQVGMNLVI